MYSWHFDMLHDTERVAKYRAAIEATIASAAAASASSAPAQLSVLDIGAGAGLLSLCAARCPEVAAVVAVECDLQLAEVTRANLARNAPRSVATAVISAHSTDMTRADIIGGGADVVVSEILDSGLIGEDCLPTIRHARRELARAAAAEGAASRAPPRFVPSRAVVWAQLVRCPIAWRWQHLACTALGNDPSRSLRLPAADAWGDGDANPHGICADAFARGGHLTPLSAPFRALDFDLADPPGVEGRSKRVEVSCTAEGELHGVLFWWRCSLYDGDDGDATAIDTRPRFLRAGAATPDAENATTETRSHWRQAISVLPAPARSLRAGEMVEIVASHTDEDIWFRTRRSKPEPSAAKRRKTAPLPLQLPRAADSGGALGAALHGACGRERLSMLNDEVRSGLLARACARVAQRTAAAAAKCDRSECTVVDIGDGSVMASLYSLSDPTARVISIENSPASALLWQNIGAANVGAVNVSIRLACEEEVEEDHTAASETDESEDGGAAGEEEPHVPTGSFDNTAAMVRFDAGRLFEDTPSIDVLIAEPFFADASTAWAGASLFRFWDLRTQLSPLLDVSTEEEDEDEEGAASLAIVCPSRGRIMASFVECAALWRQRRPLAEGASIAGLDLGALNALHPSREAADGGDREGEGDGGDDDDDGAADSVASVPVSASATLSLPLHLHQHRVLSKPVCVLDVDVEGRAEMESLAGMPTSLECLCDGSVVHAIAFWVQYELCGAKGDDAALELAAGAPTKATSPSDVRHFSAINSGVQGVHFLETPRVLRSSAGEGESGVVAAQFDANDGVFRCELLKWRN